MEQTIKIFSAKRTNRLLYTCSVVFEDRLGIKPRILTDPEQFEAEDGVRINYSARHFPDVPQIFPSELLFEKRVQDQDIKVSTVDQLPLLYAQSNAEVGHDPFAAIFFLLSRYEEYLPHRKDEHGRFLVKESIAHAHGAEKKPLVDHYIIRLRHWLEAYYPNLKFKRNTFQLEVTIDVDQLFAYRSKGLARSIASAGKELVLNFPSFSRRLNVLFGPEPDPIDIYDDICERCMNHGIRPLFFFQVGETSRYDINNPVHLPYVRNRINEIGMKADIGVHPSYFSSEKRELLEMECERLRSITSETIERGRQHYLRFQLPATFRWLEDSGIYHDYSMGFSDSNGFRASTSFPYRLFDLEREELISVITHPMVFMDMVCVRQAPSMAKAAEEALSLMQAVRAVDGVFNTTWHPETLVGLNVPFASDPILEAILESSHVQTAS